jgi:uncharacterized damage-inducible protein DinB
MLEPMKPLYQILKLNSRLFINCMEGVDDDVACKRVSERVNNIAFIAVHLVDARSHLANFLGLGIASPFKDLAAVRTIDDMVSFPTVDRLRAEWKRVTETLLKLFPRLTEVEVNAKSPERFPVDEETKLGGVLFLLQHESFHIGQLALLRKHFGLGAMRYGAGQS